MPANSIPDTPPIRPSTANTAPTTAMMTEGATNNWAWYSPHKPGLRPAHLVSTSGGDKAQFEPRARNSIPDTDVPTLAAKSAPKRNRMSSKVSEGPEIKRLRTIPDLSVMRSEQMAFGVPDTATVPMSASAVSEIILPAAIWR